MTFHYPASREPLGIEERGGVDLDPRAESLPLLIEGEQKLLALFDARQSNADARMTAAATGALALPAATLALAEPLGGKEVTFTVIYGVVVFLVIVVFLGRMLVGWKRKGSDKWSVFVFMMRVIPGWKKRRKGDKGSLLFSSESRAAATAREEWWRCEATANPIVVQERALKMWRTRAQHSRDIAQVKDGASVVVAVAFVLALGMSVAMVAQVEFGTQKPTATDDQQQRGEQPDQR